jgi:hypothetical protein
MRYSGFRQSAKKTHQAGNICFIIPPAIFNLPEQLFLSRAILPRAYFESAEI